MRVLPRRSVAAYLTDAHLYSLTILIVSRPRSTAMSRKCWPCVESFSALYLIVNIDPGKNAFPSREQELDIKPPDVAGKFFRLAFWARKLGMVDELNRQSFFDYITQRATHPDLFQELVIEPPDRFYIAGRIEGSGSPFFSPFASGISIPVRSRNRGWDVVWLFWKRACTRTAQSCRCSASFCSARTP